MDPELVAFLGVAVVVSVTPGPDMLLVMRNTLLSGRLAGVATVAGVIVGVLLWSIVAIAGVAAILAASAALFTLLKLAGAAYLIVLGISALRAKGDALEVAGPPAGSLRQAAAQGFLSAALNPKLGVFFLTLLPQFVDPLDSPARPLLLALAFAATGLAWLLVFTALVGSLGPYLARPGLRRAIQRISGAVLIGLGLRIATDR